MALKVGFHTLGCRLNQSETAVLAQSFREAGYETVREDDKSDVCVINTCTVTGVSDAKCRHSIRKLMRRNPNAKIAVIGCYAESGFQILSEMKGIDVIIGNQEKLNLLKYLPEEKLERPRLVKDKIEKDAFRIDAIGQSTNRARASLKIQDGCDFMCSFCIIPFVRGRAKGRVFENLLDEAKILKEQGFKELVLTGVNIGTYEVEGKTLLDVVDALNEMGIARIRISSIEPTTIDDVVLERMAMKNHALLPYLHLPLQSGSDRVLAAMRRKYTRDEYVDYLHHAHQIVPNLLIGTDVLLGTPEEAELDFEETLSLIREEPIDYAHAFTYSEREGTPASKKKQVPVEIRKKRTLEVRKISAGKRMESLGRQLGEVQNVLVEESLEGYWQGYTENFSFIKFKSNDRDLVNQLVSVRLKEVCGEWALAERV